MAGRASGGEIGVVPRDDALRSEKPEVVGQTMTRVRVAGDAVRLRERHVMTWVPASPLSGFLFPENDANNW